MRALTISLNLHFYASYNAAPTQTVRGVGCHACSAGMLGRQEMGMVRRIVDLTALAVFFGSCCHVSILPIAGAGTSRWSADACLRSRHGTRTQDRAH